MALIKINDNPPDRDLRQFAGIWFPLFWLVIGGVVYMKTANLPLAAALFAGGALVGAIGAWRVGFIRPIYLLWMYAAYPIGWTVSHLLLGIIFYVVMTPIGLIMRMLEYDPLQRTIDRSARSYWVPMGQARSKADYFRQA